MKLQMFSVLDMKTGAFGTPFFQSHTAQAVRAFSDLAADQSTIVGRHPADFQLVWLGAWNDENGGYEPLATPVVLGTAASFLPQTPVGGLFVGDPTAKPIGRNGLEPRPRGSVVETEG